MLDLAIDIARRERFRDGRCYSLAAVGIREDGVVVWSINGQSMGVDPRCHAEHRLLRKLGRGGIVYVARVRKDGSIGCAKPCPACERVLRWNGTKVVYT